MEQYQGHASGSHGFLTSEEYIVVEATILIQNTHPKVTEGPLERAPRYLTYDSWISDRLLHQKGRRDGGDEKEVLTGRDDGIMEMNVGFGRTAMATEAGAPPSLYSDVSVLLFAFGSINLRRAPVDFRGFFLQLLCNLVDECV